MNPRFLSNGYPPTIREIGEDVGISSTSVVNYHLNKLKDKGLLERSDQVSRGLRLAGSAAIVKREQIPLVGTIQAGLPIPVMDALASAEVDEQDLIAVTPRYCREQWNVCIASQR